MNIKFLFFILYIFFSSSIFGKLRIEDIEKDLDSALYNIVNYKDSKDKSKNQLTYKFLDDFLKTREKCILITDPNEKVKCDKMIESFTKNFQSVTGIDISSIEKSYENINTPEGNKTRSIIFRNDKNLWNSYKSGLSDVKSYFHNLFIKENVSKNRNYLGPALFGFSVFGTYFTLRSGLNFLKKGFGINDKKIVKNKNKKKSTIYKIFKIADWMPLGVSLLLSPFYANFLNINDIFKENLKT